MNVMFKPSALQKIAPDVVIGEDSYVSDFVNLYGCTVGNQSKIGPFVEIQKNASIGYGIHYPVPIHLQPAYKDLLPKHVTQPGAYPIAEKLSQSVISLPLYPELTRDQQDRVIEVIRRECGQLSGTRL